MDNIQFGYKQEFQKTLASRVCARRRDVETRKRWRSHFAPLFLFFFLFACDKARISSSPPQACELDVRRTVTVWQRQQWLWTLEVHSFVLSAHSCHGPFTPRNSSSSSSSSSCGSYSSGFVASSQLALKQSEFHRGQREFVVSSTSRTSAVESGKQNGGMRSQAQVTQREVGKVKK
jgi:hypothetical protein